MNSPTPNRKPSSSQRSPEYRDEQRNPDEVRPNPGGSWLMIVLVILILSFFFWQLSSGTVGSRIDYGFFRQQLMDDNITEVHFHGEVITGKWRKVPKNPDPEGGELADRFNTVMPSIEDRGLIPLLEEKKIKYDSEKTSVGVGTTVLLWMLGPLMIIGFFWLMMRRSADPMGSGMLGGFVKSPAKRFTPSEQQTTFNDVAAMDNAKSELQEVVEFLKNPVKFQRLGARIPKGVLLIGPPGTGKTLLARATAGEAGVPFFSISGSEFIQMFVGVGASRVRDLFRTAKSLSPSILFIDEIDAVGRVRGAGLGGGHDEREQTLNQILSEMDGFQQNEEVIVIAATNRPDVLDPALLRPGRFDRHVTVDRPNKDGRLAILKIHCRQVPLAEDVDLENLAAGTIGFSGAELRNLVNEAALNATREDKNAVEMEDFEAARDRVLMGPRREEILSEHERQMTAYHEAGHALLSWLQEDVDTVHKVTIIPRGRALGVTQLQADEERYNIGEKRLHSQLAFMMGGRSAEKLVFNEYSAGAEDDLKRATQMARRMVGYWGMSERVGPVAFRHSDEHPFLGKEIQEQREFSEEMAYIIDQEVQKFLRQAADAATEMLTFNRGMLDSVAQTLLEKESLSQAELIELIGEPAQHKTVAEAAAESSAATPPAEASSEEPKTAN